MHAMNIRLLESTNGHIWTTSCQNFLVQARSELWGSSWVSIYGGMDYDVGEGFFRGEGTRRGDKVLTGGESGVHS